MAHALVVLCLLAAPGSDSAEAAAPSVRQLVRQLDARSLADREAAEAALVARGPSALADLPADAPGMSPETRQRLDRIRTRLLQAAASRFTDASTVTLDGSQRSLADVLDELTRQTGNRVIDYRKTFRQPVEELRMAPACRETPFWKALDQLLDHADLDAYAYGEPRTIGVIKRAAGQMPRSGRAAYRGPFRFEAISVATQRSLREPSRQGLTLSLETAWEPRLTVISLKHPAAGLEVRDEDGRALTVASPAATWEATIRRGAVAAEIAVPLELPARAVRKIASFRGAVQVVLAGPVESFRFEGLRSLRNESRRLGSATVVLEEVRRSGAAWEVRMLLRFDEAADALESHRGWVFQNEAWLETPDGKRIASEAMEPTRQTQNELGLSYRFALDAPPSQMAFVYRAPTAIVPLELPYELKDIPLP